jgi:hemerythrin superfamily protein
LPIQRGTLIQDRPEIGLKMTTYLTMIVNSGELIKYVNFVNTSMTENAQTRQMATSSSLYYDHNKLIKVEEYLIEGEKKQTADWYYSEDKPLYYTLQSDKAADRATFLLTLSKGMLKQVIK